MSSREVKFSSILADLINGGGYRGNRSEILAAANITSSALSQYLGGQSRPSFQSLVALADFFDVSIDYLVFGTQIRADVAPDHGPLARYVDLALSQVQQHTQRHSALVARIGHILSSKIDEAVREAVDANMTGVPYMLSDEDLLILETYCRENNILTMDLSNDILLSPDGGEDAPGRFLPVVEQNIRVGNSYRFLLAGRLDTDWKDVVARMRRLLHAQCSVEAVNVHCKFRVTNAPVFDGVCVYRADVISLQREMPALFEVVRGFLDDDGWGSNAIPPSLYSNASAIHDPLRRDNARRQFDYLWRNGTPV